jgi:uncharacterized membrane protein YbhN (UPF0104 family)
VRKYVRVAISGGLLAWIACRTDWTDVAEKFASLRVELWLAAVGLFLGMQLIGARRWQLYGKDLGFEQTFSQYCTYTFIGMYFNLLLPTLIGGDVARVWYLNGQSGRKWPALTSVFLERVNGVAVLIATACVGWLVCPVELPSWMTASVWGSAVLAVLGLASVPLLRHWPRLSVQRRDQLQTLASLLWSPRTLIESTLLSVLVQAAGVLILWCLGTGLGLDVPIAYYAVLGPMVSLLMLLPVSVNGMGVREGATVLFLLPLGVDEPAALSLAFLWFTTGIAGSLVGGVVYLVRPRFESAPVPEAAPRIADPAPCRPQPACVDR